MGVIGFVLTLTTIGGGLYLLLASPSHMVTNGEPTLPFSQQVDKTFGIHVINGAIQSGGCPGLMGDDCEITQLEHSIPYDGSYKIDYVTGDNQYITGGTLVVKDHMIGVYTPDGTPIQTLGESK